MASEEIWKREREKKCDRVRSVVRPEKRKVSEESLRRDSDIYMCLSPFIGKGFKSFKGH